MINLEKLCIIFSVSFFICVSELKITSHWYELCNIYPRLIYSTPVHSVFSYEDSGNLFDEFSCF